MNVRWMVVPMLVTGLGVGTVPGNAQMPDSAAAAEAERFLGLLKSGDWAAAEQRVAAEIRDRLGATQLETVWGQLDAGLGELKATTLRSVTTVNGAQAVELKGDFALQPMLIRVVLSPAAEVVGFWVGPVPADAAAPPAPAPPYADAAKFHEEQVTVGADPWVLPGTLTLPVAAGTHPGVVLVHGSGPHDQDETVGGTKVFRDLAWGLASRGIAVLRYEKRTKTHGARMGADVTLDAEVVDDAAAAMALLRAHPSVDDGRVYVIGHSLGASLAPEIAKRDGRAAGAILMAGTARPIDVVMLEQLEYLGTLPQNASPAVQAQLAEATAQVQRLISGTVADTEIVMGAPASYFNELKAKDGVADAVAQPDMPFLVLQGERDYQVTMKDFALWKAALGNRPNAALRSFPALNHLFVAGSGAPNPAEYAQPGFVAEEVIEAIAAWIGARR